MILTFSQDLIFSFISQNDKNVGSAKVRQVCCQTDEINEIVVREFVQRQAKSDRACLRLPAPEIKN